MFTLFMLLVAGHALGDFALQSNYIATQKGSNFWVLLMHSFIHGGIVYFVTGSIVLMTVEVILHSVIDKLKMSGHIDFRTDQTLHVLCKPAYVGVAFA